jgi:hypothetical protein
MIRETHDWFEGDSAWDYAVSEDGSIPAVQTLPAEVKVIEPKAAKVHRHLAGADWLEDWTRYLPTKPGFIKSPINKTR